MQIENLILNTGVCNLNSVINALNYLGIKSKVSKINEDIDYYKNIIIPGVGTFDTAIKNLREYAFFSKLKDESFFNDRNLIGICVGMQVLFQKSEEGILPGLSLLSGDVKKFDEKFLKVPHMGWNKVYGKKFYKNLESKKFYFAHSFYVQCPEEYIIGYANYPSPFPVFIKKNNIYGIQFHPEKSSQNGIKFLKNIFNTLI